MLGWSTSDMKTALYKLRSTTNCDAGCVAIWSGYATYTVALAITFCPATAWLEQALIDDPIIIEKMEEVIRRRIGRQV